MKTNKTLCDFCNLSLANRFVKLLYNDNVIMALCQHCKLLISSTHSKEEHLKYKMVDILK